MLNKLFKYSIHLGGKFWSNFNNHDLIFLFLFLYLSLSLNMFTQIIFKSSYNKNDNLSIQPSFKYLIHCLNTWWIFKIKFFWDAKEKRFGTLCWPVNKKWLIKSNRRDSWHQPRSNNKIFKLDSIHFKTWTHSKHEKCIGLLWWNHVILPQYYHKIKAVIKRQIQNIGQAIFKGRYQQKRHNNWRIKTRANRCNLIASML